MGSRVRPRAAPIPMRVGKSNGGEWLHLAEAAAILGVSHDTPADGATMAACRTTLDAADCDIFAVVHERLHCLVSVDADGVDKDAAGESLDVDAFPATALPCAVASWRRSATSTTPG